MKSTLLKINTLFWALAIAASCGGNGGGGSDTEPDPNPVPAPSAATLVFPEDNSECNEGEILSDTQSRVRFQWSASQNTDSYQVNLKNLNTDATALTNSTTNEVEITILRGVPYEWFVVSRANGTNETAASPVWRFYNAGSGITNYAPFPAEAVNPGRGATISTTSTIVLEWAGNDIDNDIDSYNVFFGTEDPPALLQTGIIENTLEVNVASGQTYYWQVETVDSAGNKTLSELFNFRVE